MPPIKRPDLRYKRTSIPNCFHDKGSLFWGECRNWPYSRPLNKNDMLEEPIISNETADVVETVTSEEPGIYDDVRDPDDLIELETEPTCVELKYYPFDGRSDSVRMGVSRYDFNKGFLGVDEHDNPAILFGKGVETNNVLGNNDYLTVDTDDQYAIANASEIPVIPVAADRAESEMMPEPENLPVLVVDTDVPDDVPAIAIVDPDDDEQPALIVPAEDVIMEQNSGGAIRAYGLKNYGGAIRAYGYRTGTGETIYGGAKFGAFFKKLASKVANTGKNLAKKGVNIVKNVGKNVGKELLSTAVQTVVPAVIGAVSGGTEEDATGQGLYGGAIIAKGLYGGMMPGPGGNNNGLPSPGQGQQQPSPAAQPRPFMQRMLDAEVLNKIYKGAAAAASLAGTAASIYGVLRSNGIILPRGNMTALDSNATNSSLANFTDIANITQPNITSDIYNVNDTLGLANLTNYTDFADNSSFVPNETQVADFYDPRTSFLTPELKEMLRTEAYSEDDSRYRVTFRMRDPDRLVVFPPDEGKEHPRMLTKLELDQIYTLISIGKDYLLPFWTEPGVAPILKKNALNYFRRMKSKFT